MAISYADYSQPVMSGNPYQAPLSLDLLGRILSVKEQQFTQAGQAIQGNINKLASLDIAKSEVKDYANSKVNSLVSTLNNLSGVDLSDQNISAQLSSLGSDIYNDKTILSGISATASIRKVQDFYDKAKTDPKLNKLYSTANEYTDKSAINSYLSDGKLESDYNGPSQATPYVNYKENLLKNINGVKANLKQISTANGMVWTDETNKIIAPEQIIQMAKDLSTPDEVGQMQRDGLYQFRNLEPNTLIQKSIQLNNGKIVSASAQLQRYKSLALQASDDPIAKQNYMALAAQKEQELQNLQSVKPDQLISKFQEDPNGFKTSVYMDEFYRGLGSRFAVNETTRTNKLNPVTAFNMRYEQQERFHNDQMQAQMLALGLKYGADGKLQKQSPGDFENVQFTTTSPNTDDPDLQLTGTAAIDQQNKELADKSTSSWQNFYSSLVAANPEFSETLPSNQSGSGISVGLKNQKLFENRNNIPGIQPEDLQVEEGSPRYNDLLKKGIPREQLKFMNDLWLTYQQEALGIDHGITQLPKGAKEAFEQIQLNQAAINANNLKKEQIDNTVASQYGLTGQQLSDYNIYTNYSKKNEEFQKNASKNKSFWREFFTAGAGANETPGVLAYNDEERKVLTDPKRAVEVMKTKHVLEGEGEKIKKAYYDQLDNRVQFDQPILGEGYFGKKNIEDAKTLFAANIYNQGTTDEKIKQHKLSPSNKDIEIVSAGRDSQGFTYTARVKEGTGSDQTTEMRTVRLSPKQAIELGFNSSPYEAINSEANIAGRTTPKVVSANLNPNIPGRKKPLSAQIVVYRKQPDSRTDFSSGAYMVDQNGNKISDLPNTTSDRPDKSYAAAKALLQTAEDQGLTREQFIELVIQNRNR